MIPLSLVCAFLLYHGAFFRFSPHLSLFFSSLFSIHLGVYLITVSSSLFPIGAELLDFALNLPVGQSLIIALSSLIITYLILKFGSKGVPFIIAALASPVFLIIVNSLLPSPFSLITSLIIDLFLLALLVISVIRWREWTAITASSLAGGIGLAILFASFYYFTLPVAIILGIILSGSGFLIQKSTKGKRISEHTQ